MGGDPVNWVDPSGLGKVGFCLKVGKKIWKDVTKNQARRALQSGKDIAIKGPGSSRQARRLSREKFGDKTVRHDGHEGGLPHYQHKNGGRGHVFYQSLSGFTFIGAFGDNWVTQGGDLFNPISDVVDALDLLGVGQDGADEDGEDESCSCR